jgi:cytosine/adenosine deaminase-related metal-dependent hydrolase
VPANVLWSLVTTNAAKALRVPGIGAIEVGNVADLVAFPASGRDPLVSVLESSEVPTQVMIAGELLVPSPSRRG